MTPAKTNIFLWVLYDFANSVLAIVFVFHFSQWLVIEKGVADFGYNAILAAVSLLLLATAPALGAFVDKTGRKVATLNGVTVAMFAGYLCTSIAVLLFPDGAWLAAACFFVAHYLYQLSFIFYNALLPDLAPRENLGRISGIGQAGNWLGQIGGLLLSLPFAAGAVYIAGEPGRAQTFLPAVIVSFSLALPFILFFKALHSHTSQATARPRVQWRELWPQLRRLLRAPGLGLFLLAYFLFADALITVAANFPIYLQNVFNVPDNQKALLIVGTLVSAAIFALLAGALADRFGLKRVLAILLAAWIVILLLQGLAPNFLTFAILQLLVGGSFGAVAAVARVVMITLCPKDQMSFGFSFFTLAERSAAILGPLSWGAITWMLQDLGPLRYRIAIAAMALYVAIGLAVFLRIRLLGGGND